jgi:hypothetical protein
LRGGQRSAFLHVFDQLNEASAETSLEEETMKSALATLVLSLTAISPAMAANTAKVYNSGILVLLFVGFCALLVVAQLLPAVMSLLGMTKNAAKNARSVQTAQVRKN